jgi:hypothetical protein
LLPYYITISFVYDSRAYIISIYAVDTGAVQFPNQNGPPCARFYMASSALDVSAGLGSAIMKQRAASATSVQQNSSLSRVVVPIGAEAVCRWIAQCLPSWLGAV